MGPEDNRRLAEFVLGQKKLPPTAITPLEWLQIIQTIVEINISLFANNFKTVEGFVRENLPGLVVDLSKIVFSGISYEEEFYLIKKVSGEDTTTFLISFTKNGRLAFWVFRDGHLPTCSELKESNFEVVLNKIGHNYARKIVSILIQTYEYFEIALSCEERARVRDKMFRIRVIMYFVDICS